MDLARETAYKAVLVAPYYIPCLMQFSMTSINLLPRAGTCPEYGLMDVPAGGPLHRCGNIPEVDKGIALPNLHILPVERGLRGHRVRLLHSS
jgi:hypothetical protein